MSDSEEEAVETQLKIVFVGEPSVGKTSVIRRLCYEEFTRQYTSTVGAEFYIKRLVLPGKREVLLKLSDIGGLELRGSMLDKYLFNTDIIVLVYDITNPLSFDYMNMWIDSISNIITSPPFSAVVGNKCDLEHQRAVRLDRTNQFVKDNGLVHFLVSAKTGESVSASIFELVAKHLNVPLTKTQREHNHSVLKVELVPSPLARSVVHVNQTKSSAACSIQ